MIMVRHMLAVVLLMLLVGTLHAADDDNTVDIGFIEFLGEGKKVDGQWVDPTMIEDDTRTDSGEDKHD